MWLLNNFIIPNNADLLIKNCFSPTENRKLLTQFMRHIGMAELGKQSPDEHKPSDDLTEIKHNRRNMELKIATCFQQFLEVIPHNTQNHGCTLFSLVICLCLYFLILLNIEDRKSANDNTKETPVSSSDGVCDENTTIYLNSKQLETHLSHNIGNTLNELVFGITYQSNDLVWQQIQYLREEGIKVN